MEFERNDGKELPKLSMAEIAIKYPILYSGVMKTAGVIETIIESHDCGHDECRTEHRPKLRALFDDLADDYLLEFCTGVVNKDKKIMDALRNKIIFGLLKQAVEQATTNDDPDQEPTEEVVAQARDLLARMTQPRENP
jgi:hypothetical protein